MRLPSSLRGLAESLAKLPSIGPRQAIRLALHVSSLPREKQQALLGALGELSRVSRCVECGFPHEASGDRCEICTDPNRSARTVMVVEKETDLLSLEKVGRYAGRYLVIGVLPRGGTLSAEQQQVLARRAKMAQDAGGLDELILAVSATVAGEHLAGAVTAAMGGVAKKVTKLGRGLPRGGEIEFADEDTLGYSLDSRH
jgi:recombination protein RecR